MNWIKDSNGEVHTVVETIDGVPPHSKTGCGMRFLGHGTEDRPEGALCKGCESKLPVAEPAAELVEEPSEV